MKKILKLPLLKTFLLVAAIFILGVAVGYSYLGNNRLASEQSTIRESKYNLFVSEIYDKISKNYWDNLSDTQLVDLFRLSMAKFLTNDTVAIKTKEDLLKTIDENLKPKDEKAKKEIVVNIVSSVLASLNPVGRSGLYTQKLETQLKNTVSNINPEKDLYKDLGLAKNSSKEAVQKVFNQQSEELKKQNTVEAKQKLTQIAYAKDVLTNQDRKQNYDSAGIEPTIFTKLLTPDIGYLQFKKFSPTSFEEFQKALASFNTESSPTALIFDLRGNIGGAIDATPYFLGLFLGNNQYAYDFYQKGEYKPFKTLANKVSAMDKFHQIILLADHDTQSSAELMAASLKRYNRAIIVGVPTKGWGTVESVYPLENQIDEGEKYSVFLVHHITLRDDNQPIEGRGVEPNINITDPQWEKKLNSLIRYPELVSKVKQLVSVELK